MKRILILMVSILVFFSINVTANTQQNRDVQKIQAIINLMNTMDIGLPIR